LPPEVNSPQVKNLWPSLIPHVCLVIALVSLIPHAQYRQKVFINGRPHKFSSNAACHRTAQVLHLWARLQWASGN